MANQEKLDHPDETTPIKRFSPQKSSSKDLPAQSSSDSLRKKKSSFREYVEAFLTALLIAFFLRAFVVEAFKIPSKSMVPTLLVGDHIFVNKFIYGLRLPFSKKWVAHFGTPQRGEVIVFTYPKNESLDFIKRVVGLPGDKITIKGDDLYVNGEKENIYPVIPKELDPQDKRKIDVEKIEDGELIKYFSELPFMTEWKDYKYYVEKLSGVPHYIQHSIYLGRNEELEITVPPDHLFVMGDNRDNSSDSREWGFVPMENIKGRAMFIWLSLDHDQGGVRWHRFGKWIR
jgi:signal peptidase I